MKHLLVKVNGIICQ